MYSLHRWILLEYSFEYVLGSDHLNSYKGLLPLLLESLRARDLQTESLQSWRDPFNCLFE